MSSRDIDRRLLLTARVSLAAAWVLALVLTWVSHVSGAGSADRQTSLTVLASEYSRVGPYPVSLGGLVVYFFLLASSLPGARARGGRLLAYAEAGGCLLVLIFAAWLSALQFGVVGGFCALCTVTHFFAVIGALCILQQRRSKGSFGAPEFAFSACAAALAFNFVLVLQWLARPQAQDWSLVSVPEASAAMAPRQSPKLRVALHEGRARVDLYQLPVLGSPASKHKIYALLDPTSPESRKFEAMLRGIARGFGEDFAVVLVPGVRNGESESVQRSLLAVWHHSPGAHSILHTELADGTLKPSHSHVERRAAELVGAAALRNSYVENGANIGKVIRFGRRLRAAHSELAGIKSLPQLLIGGQVVAGSHPDPAHYARIITAEFGIGASGAVAAADGPALELVDGEMVHLGSVASGSTRDLEIMVRNRGSESLQIGWLKLPEGCAVDQMPRAAISAGEGAVIRLRWESPRDPGPVERTLCINHNGFGKRSMLTLCAHVETPGTGPGGVPRLTSATHGEPDDRTQSLP